MRDLLLGAAIAVVALVVAAALLLWWVTDPAGDDAARPAPSGTAGSTAVPTAPPAPDVDPPADLADGETWLGDLVLDAGALVTAGSVLRDVQAVGSDVRAGPDGVVAGALSVDATVPFEVVAEQLGGDGVTVRAAGASQATVERTVEVAGRELRVVATGTVEVEAGRLVLDPRSIDVGGPAFLSDAIGSLARRLVTLEYDVGGLPEGLVLRDVTVRDDGFRAELEGRDVVLAP